MKEKKKENLKLINCFLRLKESDYLPNFINSRNKKKILSFPKEKTNITLSNESKSRNKRIDLIDSFCNTQYKANHLTPFQKIIYYEEDRKAYNNYKKNQCLNQNNNKITLKPVIETNRKNKDLKNLLNTIKFASISSKEYFNKIKLYKLKNNWYKNIKNDICNFDSNLNKLKLNSIENENSSIKKIEKNKDIKIIKKHKKIKKALNNFDLNIDNKLFLSINQELNNTFNINKLKKINRNRFKKDKYEELIFNIKKDISISKRNIKKQKINKFQIDNIFETNKTKNIINNKNNSLNLFFNSCLNTNNNFNSINHIKKNSNIINLFSLTEN